MGRIQRLCCVVKVYLAFARRNKNVISQNNHRPYNKEQSYFVCSICGSHILGVYMQSKRHPLTRIWYIFIKIHIDKYTLLNMMPFRELYIHQRGETV